MKQKKRKKGRPLQNEQNYVFVRLQQEEIKKEDVKQ